MSLYGESAWAGVVAVPTGDRSSKPRTTGLTMVIDKGLTLSDTRELLAMCGDSLDFLKLAFGTSVIYSPDYLSAKIKEVHSWGVDIYPGGTLLELAVIQGTHDSFIERACELGFTAIEVSEGTIDLESNVRRHLIQRSRDHGLKVISEVGKKDRSALMNADDVVRQVEEDLQWGSEIVIIEGRDSGQGVGVYDDNGAPREQLIEGIINGVQAPNRLMWEAPLVAQQQYWLGRVGVEANLGNVQPHDLFSLETTRVGLRGDTLRSYISQNSKESE